MLSRFLESRLGVTVGVLLMCSATGGFAIGSTVEETVCGTVRTFYSDPGLTNEVGEYEWTPQECGCELVRQEGTIGEYWTSTDPVVFC